MGLLVEIDSMGYPDEKTNLIQDLHLNVPPGCFISLLGQSGIGKTTLLRIIAGLEQRYEGYVELNGKRITRPNRDIQILFQDNRLLPWMTAKDNIRFAIPTNHEQPIDEIVDHWLNIVGLNGKAKSWPKNLSGGEAARVALARAFAGDPKVLLLDEPFSSVDIRVRYDLHHEFLNALQISPKTVLLVTHNIEDAVLLSDIVYVASGPYLGSLTSFHISSDKPRQSSDPYLVETVGTIAQYMLKTVSIMED
jgi:ABC-type nitrate/sulfonate/bicarbonate transport system ATPase subunit